MRDLEAAVSTDPISTYPYSHLPEQTLEDALREAGRDASFTIEDLIKSHPGFSSDEEIDEFIGTVREWRNADLTRANPC